jgi:hypothetical protein
MAVTADKLLIAGTPAVKNPAEYRSAVAGKKGGILKVVNKADGSKMAEHKLDSAPVWDGMAIAGESVYISMKNGELVCLGK